MIQAKHVQRADDKFSFIKAEPASYFRYCRANNLGFTGATQHGYNYH